MLPEPWHSDSVAFSFELALTQVDAAVQERVESVWLAQSPDMVDFSTEAGRRCLDSLVESNATSVNSQDEGYFKGFTVAQIPNNLKLMASHICIGVANVLCHWLWSISTLGHTTSNTQIPEGKGSISNGL